MFFFWILSFRSRALDLIVGSCFFHLVFVWIYFLDLEVWISTIGSYFWILFFVRSCLLLGFVFGILSFRFRAFDMIFGSCAVLILFLFDLFFWILSFGSRSLDLICGSCFLDFVFVGSLFLDLELWISIFGS